MTDGLIILLTDVKEVLTNLLDENDKPLFRKVAIFNNQNNKQGQENTFRTEDRVDVTANVTDYPACYLEPIIEEVVDEQEGYQSSLGRLIVHIAIHKYDTEDDWQYPFLLRMKVNQALNMLKRSDAYRTLIRIGEMADTSHGNLYVWQTVFALGVADASTWVHLNDGVGSFGTNGVSMEISVEKRFVKNIPAN